jgi:hypothetical protein
MDHQKKSEHMMDRIGDLALDEIHPKAELELLAHAGECEACREAYNDAKALRALVDRGVEKLVAAEPSPQFNARLRAKLAQEPAPRRWSWSLPEFSEPFTIQTLSYVAGAGLLLAIVIFALIGLPRHQHPAPLVATIPVTPAPSPATPPNLEASIQSNSPVPERRHIKLASRATRSIPTKFEPEILVPKDELAAVAQFYEATQTGRVDTEQLYAAQQQTREPVEVKPIEIIPLESPAEAPLANSGSGPSLLN